MGRKVWCAIVNERGTSDLGSLKNAKKHAEKEITKTINQRVELAKRWLDEYTRPTPTDTKGAVEVVANAIGRIVGQSDTDEEFASQIINALISQGYMQDWQPIDICIKTMKLSGNREEYYVCIAKEGRELSTRRYTQNFYNRALCEMHELRHVILGEEEPDLLNPIYADKEPLPPSADIEGKKSHPME